MRFSRLGVAAASPKPAAPPNRRFIRSFPRPLWRGSKERPLPKRLAGIVPRTQLSPVQVKCFATIRHSSTDPNVATVAAMFNTVPIAADPTGDRDCGGDGFLLFAFCFFVAFCRSCWVRSLDLIREAPRRIGFRSLNAQSHVALAKCLRQTVNRR
jgi:hypothetical protein